MADVSKKPHFESDDTIAVKTGCGVLRLAVVNQVLEPQLSDDSSSDSSDDDSEADKCTIEMLRIEYPSGRKAKILPENAVLVDRSLMIGETVKAIDDPQKIGVVVDCQISADVVLLPSLTHVVRNVDCSRLNFITALDAGNTYVLYNGWIGDLDTVDHEIVIRSLTKGYRCKLVVDDDVEIFSHRESVQKLPFGMRHLGGLGRHLYPGQLVEISPRSILLSAQYLPTGKFPARLKNRLTKIVDQHGAFLKFAVEQVNIKQVSIRWLTNLDPLNASAPPPSDINDDDIKRIIKLNHFEHQSCQVADRMTATLRADDELMEYDQWNEQRWNSLQTQFRSDTAVGDGTQDKAQGESAPCSVVDSLDWSTSYNLAFESMTHLSLDDGAALVDTGAHSHASSSSSLNDTVNTTSDSYVTALSSASDDAYLTSASGESLKTSATAGTAARWTTMSTESSDDNNMQSTDAHAASAITTSPSSPPKQPPTNRAPLIGSRGIGRMKTSVSLINRHRKYAKLLQRRREMASAAVKRRRDANRRVTRSKLPAAVGDTFYGEIIMQRSFLKVIWQNGSISDHVAATSLSYCDYDLDQHVFLPGHLVQLQEADPSVNDVYGVVESVSAEERIATVHWFEMMAGSTQPRKRCTQMCSVLDLKYHADYEWLSTSALVLNTATSAASSNPNFQSQVGQVRLVDAPSGKALVRWFDGTESHWWPTQLIQALYGDDLDDEAEGSDDDDESMAPFTQVVWPAKESKSVISGDSSSWETASSESGGSLNEETDKSGSSLYDLCNSKSSTASGIAESWASLSSVSSSRKQHSPVAGPTSSTSMTTRQKAREQQADQPNTGGPSLVKRRRTSSKPTDTSAAPSSTWSTSATATGSMQCLGSCPPAHHFHVGKPLAAPTPIWMKALRSEMKLLATGLPASIHVRTFEDRLDLFTCLMLGPSGTPYHNGLFLFDVRLPEQYPNVPPIVHYKSFCSEQLNPNLYQDGKVCVSLLGTWSGKSSERWNPGSNLLQVFVSIQGLILNSEPYFNEAGYDARRCLPDAVHLSRKYNENALVRSLENLQRMTDEPPAYFAHEIRAHLRENGEQLMSDTERLLDDSYESEYPLTPISEGCRLSLRTRLARLRSTLNNLKVGDAN